MELPNNIIIKFTISCFIAITLFACDKTDIQLEPYSFTELAMQPDMVIEASNKNGTVIIEYISPLERRYKWGDHNEKRTLIPRKQRFTGRLGAYDPASAYFWEIFAPRIVADDSQLHFENMKDLKTWLFQGSAVSDWVYTDDGLVVGFFESPSRNQVNIDVYQLYINGEKPSKLDGSRPDNIVVKINRPNNALNTDSARNAAPVS